MVPARRLPVDRLEPQGASESASQSGIQLKDPSSSSPVIALRIPPHDPLPRIAYDDDDDDGDRRRAKKVMFDKTLPRVTSESGVPIPIAPSAASVDLLSSRPPSNQTAAPAFIEPDDLERIVTWLPLHVAVFVVVLVAVMMVAYGHCG